MTRTLLIVVQVLFFTSAPVRGYWDILIHSAVDLRPAAHPPH